MRGGRGSLYYVLDIHACKSDINELVLQSSLYDVTADYKECIYHSLYVLVIVKFM